MSDNGVSSLTGDRPTLSPQSLGNPDFRRDYNLKYNYLCGAMYKGISSVDMVVALGKADLMGFLGTGGMGLGEVDRSIVEIKRQLNHKPNYGVNLLNNPENPDKEMKLVELYLKHEVRYVEAAAYFKMSPALVRYRLQGIRQQDGRVYSVNHVLAKVSRPEVAQEFMQPPPESIVTALLHDGYITSEQAKLSQHIAMAQDICVEADSGGHTDMGNAYVLMPAINSLRHTMNAKYHYQDPLRIGAAGGIGTPESAAAAIMLGADFIVTGSINQCTVESGTSTVVKDILQSINVQDTEYAPAGDMFEIGAKVQVVKKGVFFPARANKLYELYKRHVSLDDVDESSKRQIQQKYFKRSFETVWQETKNYYQNAAPQEIADIERNPKKKMALIFRWYFIHSTRLAMSGSKEQLVDYQIQCGPAMGAFNQWVKGTQFEQWQARYVADIAHMLMTETAKLLNTRFGQLFNTSNLSTSNRIKEKA